MAAACFKSIQQENPIMDFESCTMKFHKIKTKSLWEKKERDHRPMTKFKLE